MFSFNLSILFVAFALAVVVAQHDPNYCYVTDPIRPQLNRFSSRTAYETIRGRSINPGVSGILQNIFYFETKRVNKSLFQHVHPQSSGFIRGMLLGFQE